MKMLQNIRQLCMIAVLAFLVFISTEGATHAGIIGQWKFNSGQELVDSQGNFGNLLLRGNAVVIGGALNVNGSGTSSTGWAVTSGYTGPSIQNKTLVSWLTLESFNANAGSAITIDRISGDHFDGIIFGERQMHRWMNGSSNFNRTQDFSPGFVETTGSLVQVAISYQHVGIGSMTVTGYRNGILLGSYTTGSPSFWLTNDAEVFFGLRHGNTGGGPGGLDALIAEARIYNTALTQSEIQGLRLDSAVPEPSGLILIVTGLLGVFGYCSRRRGAAKSSVMSEA